MGRAERRGTVGIGSRRGRGRRARAAALGATLAAAMAAVLGTAAAPATAGGKGGGGGGSGISTQGTVIVCDGTSGANRGTYRMNPDGTGLTRISTDIYANDVTRGQAVLTVLMNVAPGVDIQALRADGVGGLVPLVISSEGESSLRFSQDGSQIAYKVNRIGGASGTEEIRTADVLRDGSGNVTGVTNLQTVWTGGWYVRSIDFSRDGSRIVMSAAPGGGAPDLYVLTLADSSLEQLTNTPTYEEAPRWSPADDRIAYLRRADAGTAVGSLLTIDYGTRAQVTVLDGRSGQYASPLSWPAWSPGATHLLTVVGGYKKPVDLYQFPSTGGGGVNVTASTDIQPIAPAWGW